MKYVDGFVLVVKDEKLGEYKKMAAFGKEIWMKHGALEYFECVGDDMSPDMPGMEMVPFPELAKAGEKEKIIFAFIIYENKAHRDSVNKKVMEDPAMKEFGNMGMPFDMKKMSFGGFEVIVEGKK
jgi:uncharacterized protein YbaA (DUF1428 family)